MTTGTRLGVNTNTLRLGRYLKMGTGLRRYDTEWVEGVGSEAAEWRGWI